MLLACSGWECSMLISVSDLPGGNPVARDDPEHFAIRFQVCDHCRANFCHRCMPVGRWGLRRPRCPHCTGRLLPGTMRLMAHNQPLSPDVAACKEGVRLGEDGQFDAALAELERAVALRPGYPDAHHYRGAVLEELGRYAEALAAYELADRQRPGHPPTAFDRGRVLGLMNRHEPAVEAYRQALEMEPRHLNARVNLGATLNQLGRYEEALIELDRSIALAEEGGYRGGRRDSRSYAYAARAAVLVNLGRYDEALTAVDVAISCGPDRSDMYYNRAYILRQLGRRREAEQAERLYEDVRSRDTWG